jgi:hypothetical protein
MAVGEGGRHLAADGAEVLQEQRRAETLGDGEAEQEVDRLGMVEVDPAGAEAARQAQAPPRPRSPSTGSPPSRSSAMSRATVRALTPRISASAGSVVGSPVASSPRNWSSRPIRPRVLRSAIIQT